jgi:hypothetical protein
MDYEMKEDSTGLKNELVSIREELEDHLSSINESSDEIEHNYSYLMELDGRISLIEKKLDSVLSALSKLTNVDVEVKRREINLTDQEKETFMVFYSSERALNYEDLCSKTGKSESYIRSCVNNIIEKGVPIRRHSRSGSADNKVYFTLDRAFRELQAKSNILNIGHVLTLDCFDQSVKKE